MKLSKLMAVALPVALLFASCDSDSQDGSTYTFTVNGTSSNGTAVTYTAVKSPDNTWKTFAGADHTMKFDLGTGLCDIQVANLQYKEGGSKISFAIPAQKFYVNATSTIWAIPTLKTPVTVPPLGLTLDNLTLWTLTWYGQSLFDMDLSYELDGYLIRTIPAVHNYMGTTTTNTLDESTGAYPYTKSVYSVTMKPATMTLDITVTGAKFDNAMPELNMVFSGIPYTYTDAGLSFAADKIIPTIKDTPYDNYALTNVSGSLKLQGEFILNFDCAGKWHTNFKGLNPYYPVQQSGN